MSPYDSLLIHKDAPATPIHKGSGAWHKEMVPPHAAQS